MELIDYNSWNRKEIYEFFSTVSNPFYMVSFRLDVTILYAYAHQNHLSFYLSLVYLCTKAINEVKNFRYKFVAKTHRLAYGMKATYIFLLEYCIE